MQMHCSLLESFLSPIYFWNFTKYYFITWTFFFECWCNGLLNCVIFTYQKCVFCFVWGVQIHFKIQQPTSNTSICHFPRAGSPHRCWTMRTTSSRRSAVSRATEWMSSDARSAGCRRNLKTRKEWVRISLDPKGILMWCVRVILAGS